MRVNLNGDEASMVSEIERKYAQSRLEYIIKYDKARKVRQKAAKIEKQEQESTQLEMQRKLLAAMLNANTTKPKLRWKFELKFLVVVIKLSKLPFI